MYFFAIENILTQEYRLFYAKAFAFPNVSAPDNKSDLITLAAFAKLFLKASDNLAIHFVAK